MPSQNNLTRIARPNMPGVVHAEDIIDLISLKARAWCVVHSAEPAGRILGAQTTILEQRQKLMEAQRNLDRLARESEHEAYEWALLQRQMYDPHGEGKSQTQHANESDRLVAQREQRRAQRGLPPAGDTPFLVSVRRAAASSQNARTTSVGPYLELYLSDHEIESIATKAVVGFAILDAKSAATAWANWYGELSARYPAYAVEEIARRAEELRGLAMEP